VLSVLFQLARISGILDVVGGTLMADDKPTGAKAKPEQRQADTRQGRTSEPWTRPPPGTPLPKEIPPRIVRKSLDEPAED
jgi:hypothetical protein